MIIRQLRIKLKGYGFGKSDNNLISIKIHVVSKLQVILLEITCNMIIKIHAHYITCHGKTK